MFLSPTHFIIDSRFIDYTPIDKPNYLPAPIHAAKRDVKSQARVIRLMLRANLA